MPNLYVSNPIALIAEELNIDISLGSDSGHLVYQTPSEGKKDPGTPVWPDNQPGTQTRSHLLNLQRVSLIQASVPPGPQVGGRTCSPEDANPPPPSRRWWWSGAAVASHPPEQPCDPIWESSAHPDSGSIIVAIPPLLCMEMIYFVE